MELLQRHNVYKIGEDEVLRPPVVALRILVPDSDDAKIAKICSFWRSWPVFKLINHLFKIRQKAFLPNALWM